MSAAERRMARRRRRAWVVVAVLAVLGVGLLGACIIADPLPEQRSLPTRPPSIESTAPPASAIVTELPTTFIVNVRLYNPLAGFQWRAFLDYDSLPGTSPRTLEEGPSREVPRPFADLQVVSFKVPDYVEPKTCHKFEFRTALSLISTPPHASQEGVASVTWFYVPMGDYSKCALYDGGSNDGALFDAGTDAPGEAASP